MQLSHALSVERLLGTFRLQLSITFFIGNSHSHFLGALLTPIWVLHLAFASLACTSQVHLSRAAFVYTWELHPSLASLCGPLSLAHQSQDSLSDLICSSLIYASFASFQLYRPLAALICIAHLDVSLLLSAAHLH